jgi:hypothetical protein
VLCWSGQDASFDLSGFLERIRLQKCVESGRQKWLAVREPAGSTAACHYLFRIFDSAFFAPLQTRIINNNAFHCPLCGTGNNPTCLSSIPPPQN